MADLIDIGDAGTAIHALDGTLLMRLDGNVSERHTRRAKLSSFPGPRVRTDNAEAEPGALEVSGILTETPYEASIDLGAERMRAGLAILDELIESGQQLIVTSELRVYSPVQLDNYEVSKRAKEGRSAGVRLSFKRALIAEIQTVEVPASILSALVRDRARSPSTRRVQPTVATDEQAAAAKKSVFAGFADGGVEALRRLAAQGTR